MKEGEIMQKKNQIEFKVSGKYALFTDPFAVSGGEKTSYMIPTYEALKGICKSIYFKPTFTWVIDDVRVVNTFQTFTKGIRPIVMNGGNTLACYTYLYDVEYEVRAHFEWNLHHDELKDDRNENKHYFIAKRLLKKGGRRDVFLGTRECQADVEPCVFGEKKGAFDDVEEKRFGNMFHGFIYPDEYVRDDEKGKLVATLWTPVMKHGVIHFIRPEECPWHRVVGSGDIKRFNDDNFTTVNELEKEGGILELDK